MKKLLMSALLVAASSQATAANLVVNGSFETPELASGTWSIFQTGESGLGWTTGRNGLEIRNNVAGTANHGEQFAELDTTNNSYIFQDLNTVAGKTYRLTFDYSPRIGQLLGTNGINVFWGDHSTFGNPANAIQSLTGSGAGLADHSWVTYSLLVEGSGLDTLKFWAFGESDSYGGSLDNISVSAVPVPAAALLFAPAVLGFMGLRRKAKQA